MFDGDEAMISKRQIREFREPWHKGSIAPWSNKAHEPMREEDKRMREASPSTPLSGEGLLRSGQQIWREYDGQKLKRAQPG